MKNVLLAIATLLMLILIRYWLIKRSISTKVFRKMPVDLKKAIEEKRKEEKGIVENASGIPGGETISVPAEILPEPQMITSEGCTDKFDKCAEYADNGECVINPEFMLYNCPQSCKVCGVSPSMKYDLTEFYNTKSPIKCIYHGKPYPGKDYDIS